MLVLKAIILDEKTPGSEICIWTVKLPASSLKEGMA
jgi:hypothetical protein